MRHIEAKIDDQSLKYWPKNTLICTISVLTVFFCKKSIAMKKSFHMEITFSTATVPIAGFKSGNTILKKMLKTPQPSIIADSSSCLGTFFI